MNNNNNYYNYMSANKPLIYDSVQVQIHKIQVDYPIENIFQLTIKL